MVEQRWIFSLLSILLVTLRFECLIGKEIKVPVGIVLDQNSTVGEMAENFMAMAISDFYAANDNYQTRLSLIKRDSRGDVVSAASAVLDLMENEEVQAIIGPQSSSQANFVIELGGKAQVPIISFSATSPSLSPAKSQYFVRTAHNDSFQVKAIASIVHAYGWQEIVIIYEDTDYGNGLIPYLLDSFQELGTRIFCRINILASYTDNEITRELKNMKNKRRSIFVVHMAATNGARLFSLAKKVGMMGEGYAWLVTQGLSILLDPVDEKVMMDSMLGVLGVRPYIPNSEKLKKFKPRWEKNFSSNRKLDELNLFGLWAYDTIWAIAMAVEKTVDNVKSSSLKHNRTGQSTRINLEAAIGISSMGPKLLKSILSTSFQGLSGEFHLAKGELKPKALEIFNVIGNKERILGYYSLNGVLSKSLTSKDKFKQPLWPGDTLEQPRKLRIGVPVKTGFSEFMKVKWHPETAEPIVSGFSADVFREMHKMLPFPLPYEFIPFADKDRKSRGTYDQLLDQIRKQEVDAAVGDITVVAKRSLFVDFTLPFSESGVSMVVLMKHDERDNMWIFLKPLSRNLWLTTALAFIFTGLVVWVLEHRINTDFRGPPDQQFSTVFWFSFSTLVFAHREKLLGSWTRFVVIIWFFVVLIISQSYTASLASMLTVKRMQPTFADVKEIQRNGHFVGYQSNSFVKDFLIKQLNFSESKLKNYSTPEDYAEALSLGIHNGGVAAIFDEIPYIKLFLAKFCSKFQMVGPTYKTDGFGFAFPLGSPLVSNISRAILNVTQDKGKMDIIERSNFPDENACDDQIAPNSSGSLSVTSFGGLFIITGLASIFSLLIHIMKFIWFHWPISNTTHHPEGISFWLRILELAKHFDQKDPSVHYDSRVHPTTSPAATSVGASPDHNFDDHTHNVSRIPSQGAEVVARYQDNQNETTATIPPNSP